MICDEGLNLTALRPRLNNLQDVLTEVAIQSDGYPGREVHEGWSVGRSPGEAPPEI